MTMAMYVPFAWALPTRSEPVGICAAAAAESETYWGLPPGILWAVGMVESRKGGEPWPWTLNFNSSVGGRYFASRDAAAAPLAAAIAAGDRNIDIGCFQVNWRWHSAGAHRPEVFLEPRANAYYAGFMLRELYDRSGSWDTAIGKYHSAQQARGFSYGCKVLGKLVTLDAYAQLATRHAARCGGRALTPIASAAERPLRRAADARAAAITRALPGAQQAGTSE